MLWKVQIVKDSSFETMLDQNFEREIHFSFMQLIAIILVLLYKFMFTYLTRCHALLSMNVILNDSEMDKDDWTDQNFRKCKHSNVHIFPRVSILFKRNIQSFQKMVNFTVAKM